MPPSTNGRHRTPTPRPLAITQPSSVTAPMRVPTPSSSRTGTDAGIPIPSPSGEVWNPFSSPSVER